MKSINKILIWIKAFFKKNIPVAVHVVQAVKQAIDNGTVDIVKDIIKALIPGDVDDFILDRVVAYIKKHIPVLCIQLEIIQAVSSGDTLEQSLNSLKSVYGDKWAQFTSELAGDILVMLEDGKIDRSEAIKLAKDFYDGYVKK